MASLARKVVGAREYFHSTDHSTGKVRHDALELDSVRLLAEELGHSMYQGEHKPHVRLHIKYGRTLDCC